MDSRSPNAGPWPPTWLLAEREFAAWFGLSPGHDLVFSDGWWTVQPAEDGQAE